MIAMVGNRDVFAWPQANNISSGAAAICGVDDSSVAEGGSGAPRLARAAALRRSRRRQNASPAQRGPRRESTLAPVLLVRSSLHKLRHSRVRVRYTDDDGVPLDTVAPDPGGFELDFDVPDERVGAD